MKTVSQILDDRLYSRDDRDPRAMYYRTNTGNEFEISAELRDELNVDFGACVEANLLHDTDLTLDEFIAQRAVLSS
jgi:hypothetical protein